MKDSFKEVDGYGSLEVKDSKREYIRPTIESMDLSDNDLS